MEPSEEEVQKYAAFLNMQLPEDEDLLWIAREGVSAPLPASWTACRTDKDQVFYHNFDTGESRWEHPCDEYYRQQYLAQKAKKAAEKQAGSSLQATEENERREILRLHKEALQRLAKQREEILTARKDEILSQARKESAAHLEIKRNQIDNMRKEIEQSRTRAAAIRSSALSKRTACESAVVSERLQAEMAVAEEAARLQAATQLKLERERQVAESVFMRHTALQQGSIAHSHTSLQWATARAQADTQERLDQALIQSEAEFNKEQERAEKEFQANLKHLSVTPAEVVLQQNLAQYRSQTSQILKQRKELIQAQMQAKLHEFEHRLAAIQASRPTPQKNSIPSLAPSEDLRSLLNTVEKETERVDYQLLEALREILTAREHNSVSLDALWKLKEQIMPPN